MPPQLELRVPTVSRDWRRSISSCLIDQLWRRKRHARRAARAAAPVSSPHTHGRRPIRATASVQLGTVDGVAERHGGSLASACCALGLHELFTDKINCCLTRPQSSLTLLKSKMSRRKSRSAPTNPSASLFVDKNPVNSARAAPSSMQQPRYPAPQQVMPRSNAASRGSPPGEQQAPPQPPPRRSNPAVQPRKQQMRDGDDDDDDPAANDSRRPPPISSGFNQSSEMVRRASDHCANLPAHGVCFCVPRTSTGTTRRS